MTTKITQTRGRPNPTQIIDTSTSPLISNIATTINAQTNAFQQQFVPSLLRIESVVPSRLNANRFARVNRVITRSYSTLCGTAASSSILASSVVSSPFSLSNALAATSTAAAVPAPTTTSVNYKNVTKRINTNLQQRHKTNHHHQRLDNGSESPMGKINNSQQTTSETCCIMVENGIQKVRRTMKEKEKQPDRISLDRRGLCTIPIIDNEPSLRLLSLQHNLINTFNIPDSSEAAGATNNSSGEVADGDKDNNNNNLTSLKEDKLSSSTNESAAAIINKTTITSTTPAPPKPFLKQRSISRNQLNLNFSANNNATTTSTTTTTTPTGAAANPSFLQKQFVFAPSATKHGLLKRANSVMINYTPPPAATTMFAPRGKLVATPSFSSVIDTGTHHELPAKQNNSNSSSNNSPDIQIDANNSYLRCFRFNLTNLVFLDLYNNQIEKISNLDGLKSLTVLLLGKNRITDISGIVSLRLTLRVLDLHGNRIANISKISQLQELKSLNLAGNQLRQIQPSDFAGLQHLKELNLKRNRIKRINFSDDLHCLERLWLCHNELQSIDDMASIAKSINLKEITIENNPISLAGDCVSFIVSYLPLLNTLNQLQITEQVRRAANAWRRNKENSDKNFQNLSSDVSSSIRREEIISNARTNWELIRQANILSLSSQQRQNTHHQQQLQAAKKFGMMKTSKLTPNNSSSSTSTASSNNNALNIDSKSMTMKNSSTATRQIIDVAKRQKSKLLKSLSAENSSLVSTERLAALVSAGDVTDMECEYFHLPPVLDEMLVDKGGSSNKNQSAASSTRPNIDSESSAFSSDTDDQKSFKSQIPTTPPIQPPKAVSQPSEPTIETIIIRAGEEEDDDDEKMARKATTSFVPAPLLPSLTTTEIERQPVAALLVDSTTTSLVNGNVSSKITSNFEAIKRDETVDDDQLSRLLRRRSPSPISSVVSKELKAFTIIDNNTSNANAAALQPSTISAEIAESSIVIAKSAAIAAAPPTAAISHELKLVETTTDADIKSTASAMISKSAAAKASTDSINTISSMQDERQTHTNHATAAASTTSHHHHNTSHSGARSRSSHSRKLGPPLVRSQTARNLSSQINNSGNSSTNQQSTSGSSVNTTGASSQNPSNGSNNQKKESKKEIDKDRETGGDYLVEILGRYLNVYGMGAIKFVDKQWNAQKAHDVHTVKFSYINFNSISPVLGRIKARFPNVENYVFRETNFVCLGQLNAMADTQGLKSIVIDPEGNPLASKNWRTYAIYRLSHWGLKQINGVEIADEEIAEAEATYSGLSELVLWSLPDSLLQPLFARLRVDEVVLNNKMTPKEWLMKQADENIRQVVGKEALQWKKHTATQQDELTVRRRGKVYFSTMMENTVNAVDKLQKLEYLWPNLLLELIRNTLIDYSQIDLYVRNLMSEVVRVKEN